MLHRSSVVGVRATRDSPSTVRRHRRSRRRLGRTWCRQSRDRSRSGSCIRQRRRSADIRSHLRVYTVSRAAADSAAAPSSSFWTLGARRVGFTHAHGALFDTDVGPALFHVSFTFRFLVTPRVLDLNLWGTLQSNSLNTPKSSPGRPPGMKFKNMCKIRSDVGC